MVTDRPSILFCKCDYFQVDFSGFLYRTQNLLIISRPTARVSQGLRRELGAPVQTSQILQLTKAFCLEVRKLLGFLSTFKNIMFVHLAPFRPPVLAASWCWNFLRSGTVFPLFIHPTRLSWASVCAAGQGQQWSRQTTLPSSRLNGLARETHIERELHK